MNTCNLVQEISINSENINFSLKAERDNSRTPKIFCSTMKPI